MPHQPIISIRGLGKRYRLGETLRHDTFRDHLAAIARSLVPYRGAASGVHREGEFWALRDVSFDVDDGEVVGIIGRNGAGKSTLLKILSQITEPTTGEVRVRGRLASLLEVGTGFHPELTGRENVYLNGAILGMTKREVQRKFDEIVAFAGVERFLDTPVKRYSSGMHVRLAFAVAAHLEPEILVVDEVLAVGDAEFQAKCLGKMQDVAGHGRTVLFVSHNMRAIRSLCSRCVTLAEGRLVSMSQADAAVAAYLGTIGNHTDSAARNSLLARTDRTGSGVARFADFWVEDGQGRRVQEVMSGQSVSLVFTVSLTMGDLPAPLDIGFSIHAHDDTMHSVLYSSYQNVRFRRLPQGESRIRCNLETFPFNAGRILIRGRMTCGIEEADWPREPLGSVTVVDGDFYGTGQKGFGSGAPFLVRGAWQQCN